MRVIVIASQKGGVGKTTIAGHLGVYAEANGHGPVVLVDTDPQRSLQMWWQARAAETPQMAALDNAALQNLPEALEGLRGQGYKLAIIDTPPAITDVIARCIACADLVVIPTRPSPHDLRAIGPTVELVDEAGVRMAFAINGAAPRARITGEAATMLSQHGTVAPVTLYQRTDFASSMSDGRTVQEVDPNSRSAAEVADLWNYIAAQLRRPQRRKP